MSWKCLLIVFSLFGKYFEISYANFLKIRGGASTNIGNENGEIEYYDQFHLDYGKKDNVRIAGAMRGFLETGKLKSLEEKDTFLKWLNNHLEDGPEPLEARTKPFYALDFGTRSDLRPGECPKIMIVTRKLKANDKGELLPGASDIDVEERSLWQPWLRSRCNFVVRYIVPNRINIIRIMEAKNRFSSQLQIKEKKAGKDAVSKEAWVKVTFRPRLVGRFLGKRDVVMERQLDAVQLFGAGAKQSKSSGLENVLKTVFKQMVGGGK